ncbi:MAG: hypothetical protein KDD83_17270, partial [Caldilineaceae bacterium]|nr:hypothetical protein [Caldilineaceae bacterium]
GVALDVAWIGDRYRVAYKFMSKNNEPRTIALRDFDAAGNPLGTGWTTATTQAVPTASRPALAYNPRTGETLLLYLNQGSGLRRILYAESSLEPKKKSSVTITCTRKTPRCPWGLRAIPPRW